MSTNNGDGAKGGEEHAPLVVKHKESGYTQVKDCLLDGPLTLVRFFFVCDCLDRWPVFSALRLASGPCAGAAMDRGARGNGEQGKVRCADDRRDWGVASAIRSTHRV